MSRYQKGKTNLDFTEARGSEWQWHQLGHMQVCTSLQTDNHASTPLLSFFTGWMPFLLPNQQRQSTEGMWQQLVTYLLFTRCVENVIRASERVSKLESRLAAAETDRDAARLRLGELQQNNSPARTCQHCLQLNDSPLTAGALLLLSLIHI